MKRLIFEFNKENIPVITPMIVELVNLQGKRKHFRNGGKWLIKFQQKKFYIKFIDYE